MKKQWKYIIGALVLILLIAAAGVGYKYLSERYSPETQGTPPTLEDSSSAQSTAPDGKTTVADTASADSSSAESTAPTEKRTVADTTSPARRATDFSVLDSDGNTVKLSDFTGKPVVVNFWATWCSPCKSELPAFEAMNKQYGDDVVFLMVNLTDGYRETVEGVKKFVADQGYGFPVYFDTEYNASDAYFVSSIPMSVFINAQGEQVSYHIGAMSEATLKGYIDSIM